MRTKAIILLLAVVLIPYSGIAGEKKFSKGSLCLNLGGQVGNHPYDVTADPFDKMLPVGTGFELGITDHIGIGGSVMYYKWSDYLGMFCGKFTFRIIKPSFDVAYHFSLEKLENFDFFVGESLGYSILSASNELGNACTSELKSELYVAPFLGTNIYFFDGLSASLRIHWSLVGDFSGVSSVVGINYKIK